MAQKITNDNVKMYMVTIMGWTEVTAFSTDLETAKKLALKEKKRLCKDDAQSMLHYTNIPGPAWSWERVSEYFGTRVEEITNGTVIS